MLDSTVVLATAAAVTERITIGYGVMLLALRPVAWAAKQISSLQYVSGERVVLGVGTGNPAHGDIGWRAAGVRDGTTGTLVPGAPASYAVWDAGALDVSAPRDAVQRWSTDAVHDETVLQ